MSESISRDWPDGDTMKVCDVCRRPFLAKAAITTCVCCADAITLACSHSLPPADPKAIIPFEPIHRGLTIAEGLPLTQETAKQMNALSLRVLHQRQQTLERWLLGVLTQEMPELIGQTEEEVVRHAIEQGYVVHEAQFPGQDALTTHAIVFRRVEGQAEPEVVSSMTFQATFDGDKEAQDR